ncbi:hypothetical protein [Spiroplasma poulsonii]|uniref:hypothetical protein n=1 Tax=Spiroplasma poulsonii TaxID=2138 RepID=UPI001F4D0FCD|nr:hypothetical protein [Spiroplasma poulsonii]UNF62508.1 hypothetical protein MNU24_03355 [Spiroplasma poulsonii]
MILVLRLVLSCNIKLNWRYFLIKTLISTTLLVKHLWWLFNDKTIIIDATELNPT